MPVEDDIGDSRTAAGSSRPARHGRKIAPQNTSAAIGEKLGSQPDEPPNSPRITR